METIIITSSSISKLNNESKEEYFQRITVEINQWPADTFIGILPEYCWGDIEINDVLPFVTNISQSVSFGIIFGSILHESTNSAMFVYNGDVKFIQKETILRYESERGIVKGYNQGVIYFKGKRIAILICADLWNYHLLERIVLNERADLVFVPSFTVVQPGFREYARNQWIALAITRSREFIVPIIIADKKSNSDYDTGEMTAIIDPSIKTDSIKTISDFICFPDSTASWVSGSLDFTSIAKYKEYRTELGIYSKEIIK
ncbi:MAG: carbon-nitrogen hydrolase family protein [Candidatus Heimdallarchaeota archaeon]|nr:carbon-nitrogen hydrolase family protein [Candidatus Heimdallarchaeota archaeon]